jgi:hypothetical protein
MKMESDCKKKKHKTTSRMLFVCMLPYVSCTLTKKQGRGRTEEQEGPTIQGTG